MRITSRKIVAALASASAVALALAPRPAAAQEPPRGSQVYAAWFAESQALHAKLQKQHKNRRGATNPLAAEIADYEQHSYPYVGINANTMTAAIAQRNAMAIGMRGVPTTSPTIKALGPLWQSVGPSILDVPTNAPTGTGLYPLAGRVTSVAYDPVAKGTYYVTSGTGGIWKTTNYGVAWTQLTDANPYGVSFSSIAIDPTNTKVLYAGTGDYDFTKHLGNGLLKSINGGATWTNVSLVGNTQTFGNSTIRRIVIDPSNHNHIIVALGRNTPLAFIEGFTLPIPVGGFGPSGGAIVSSTDGGAHWTQTLPAAGAPPLQGYVDDLAYSMDGKTLYAGIDFVGVEVSINNGATWKLVGNTGVGPSIFNGLAGIINGLESHRVMLAPSAIDASTVYALSEDQLALFKSTNKGANWTDISGDMQTIGDFTDAPFDFYIACGKVTTYPNGTKASGVSGDGLYLGVTDILQSTNGGRDWNAVLNVETGADIAHSNQHALAFNPTNSNEMLIGTDGGIYRMSFAPAVNGISTVGLNSTLETTDFLTGATAFLDPAQLLGGILSDGLGHADDLLTTWTNPGQGDGGAALINPMNYKNQYGSADSTFVFVTDNDWVTQTAINPPVPAVAPFEPVQFPNAAMCIDPLNPDLVYFGTDYVYQYKHSTNTWTKGTKLELPAPAGDDSDYITCIAVSPLNDQVMVAGTRDGLVWVTQNGSGGTWNPIGGGLPNRTITSLAFSTLPQIDPLAVSRLFLTLGGATGFGGGGSRVWKTNNLLATFILPIPGVTFWTPIGGNGAGALPDINVNSIVVLNHTDEQTMYVADDVGVFATANGGGTWTNAGNAFGLPTSVVVSQLNFEPSTGYLTAATYGRGQWRTLIGNTNELQMYLNLQGYRGSRAGLTPTADIFNLGQLAPVLEEKTLPITTSGWFDPFISAQGSFDVVIKLPRFLHKRIKNVKSPGSQFISPLILAGDCAPNGTDPVTGLTIYGDNTVNMADVTWVLNHMGLYSKTTADIDGDGVVTQHDLDLVMANFGMAGDN